MLLALAPRPRRDHIAITGIEIFAEATAGGPLLSLFLLMVRGAGNGTDDQKFE